MSFLKKISELFSSSRTSDDTAYWLYVRCKRCGESIRTRVDLHNDLSANYGEGGEETTYLCRKVLMGQERCFQRIEVQLTFDQQRKLIDRQISGGDFISEDQYLASTDTG
ncbi:MAG TPA: hypothetical protein VFZ76_12510 [Anaerolineales bacterium]